MDLASSVSEAMVYAADSTGLSNNLRGLLVWVIFPALAIVAAGGILFGLTRLVGRVAGAVIFASVLAFAPIAVYFGIGDWGGQIINGFQRLAP